MKELKFKDSIVNIKNYIVQMPKQKRVLYGSIAAAVLVLAVILALSLNGSDGPYAVLYPEITATEAGTVYQTLLEMGATPKINKQGQVMVPENELDIWILQLAAKGYPQSAPPYDIFSSHTGLTATETETKQWLVYQLQDRIQTTLKRIGGVENAIVTITIPDSSQYVWEQATKDSKATAGVLLTLSSGVNLSGTQVSSIKNLVASNVPKMVADDVTVVNAQTGLELNVTTTEEGMNNAQSMALEAQVQQKIEENIVRLLAPRYGLDGVVAVAKVTLDYDKMMTEKMELVEKPGENGGGYLNNDKGSYGINGNVPAGGIVGEQDNTEPPQYAYNNPDGENGMTQYWWDRDYDYGYIKTQIEQNNAKLKRATVSVMVNETSLSPTVQQELISLVSGSTDIAPELIYVSTFSAPENPNVVDPTPNPLPVWLSQPWYVYAIAGGVLLVLILVVLILVKAKAKKKKQAELAAKALLGIPTEEDDLMEQMQMAEIAKHKKELEDAARNGLDPKDEAVVEEVRNFAKGNPEVTANLLRSWLKEGE